MIQATSLDSYISILPELGNLQRIVYDKLLNHPMSSNRDLSKLLDWEINRVTPRIKELRELNLVISCGIKKDIETHKNVIIWKVK